MLILSSLVKELTGYSGFMGVVYWMNPLVIQYGEKIMNYVFLALYYFIIFVVSNT